MVYFTNYSGLLFVRDDLFSSDVSALPQGVTGMIIGPLLEDNTGEDFLI
jgi:hypothetical protein